MAFCATLKAMKLFRVLVFLVVLFGVIVYVESRVPGSAPTTAPAPTEEVLPEATDNPVVCAQVITPARNTATGEIREFSTPCDVPDGWETIQNDIPDLDLDLELI